jgi:hypothetical protein
MAINAYATKNFECDEYVVYSYGSNINEQTGEIRLNKDPFELIIIKTEANIKNSRELFKIALKIESIFIKTGVFPDIASSAS